MQRISPYTWPILAPPPWLTPRRCKNSMSETTAASPPTPGTPAKPQRPTPQSPEQPLATFLERRTASRLRARRVRRLVRHVEPWSVLKMSLIFYFCLWAILLIAGVILWRFAVTAGTVDNVENFIKELFALETFTFNPDQIFRVSALGGLVMVVAGSGFTVLMAVLFNLISDLIGGVRMTVVEEETARPRPKRARPRRAASGGARYAADPTQGPAPDAARPRRRQAATEDPAARQADETPFWPSGKRDSPKRGSSSKRWTDR